MRRTVTKVRRVQRLDYQLTLDIKIQNLVYTKLKLTHTHPDYMYHCLGFSLWLRIPQNVRKAASAILQDTLAPDRSFCTIVLV